MILFRLVYMSCFYPILETQGVEFTTVDKIPFQDYESISISISGVQNTDILLGASDNVSFMLRRSSNRSTVLAQTLSIKMFQIYRDIPSAQLCVDGFDGICRNYYHSESRNDCAIRIRIK